MPQTYRDDISFCWMLVDKIGILYQEKPRKLVELIIENDGITSGELLKKSGLKESTFHEKINQLEDKMIIQRIPQLDRTVIIELTGVSEKIFAVSKEMLDKIESDVENKFGKAVILK